MKWFIKIALKIFISRLPIPYSFWKITGLFKHGGMDSYEYAIKIFDLHFYRAFPNMQSIFGAYVVFKGWSKVLDKVISKVKESNIPCLLVTHDESDKMISNEQPIDLNMFRK